MNPVKQEIRFCTSADGVRIAYATAGAGPPLVKAANWFSHIEYDWRMPVWHHWHAALALNHTYYRYDRRGCGLSDWDPLQTFEGYCLDLEAVVSAAQLERFALFGMGHGGAIAVLRRLLRVVQQHDRSRRQARQRLARDGLRVAPAVALAHGPKSHR